MNKALFNQLIKDPASVDPKYKTELAQLVASFPYSANLKLLHLSALLNDTDIHFESELKKTACFISDRRVLRKIVQQPIDKSNYIIKEFESSLSIVGNDIKLEKENVDLNEEEIILSTDSSVKFDDQSINDRLNITSETEVETIQNKEEVVTSEISSVDEKINTTEIISELNKQIIASAVDASLSMEVSSIEVKEENIASEKNTEEKKSFLDWIGGKNLTEDPVSIDPKIQERLEFRKKAEDLINQFIVDQPRIDTKKEFFSPGNMAKKSIEDQNEIVSETLAKVYAAQGDNSKAIATYNQLILRNPEKKTYFASLIKDLKSI